MTASRWTSAKRSAASTPASKKRRPTSSACSRLKWLVDKGVLPKNRLEEYYASYLAGIFRTVRFGTGEAHGRAEMMEFNYLARTGRHRAQAAGATASTTRRCRGDRAARERAARAGGDGRSRPRRSVVRKYDKMPAELKAALDAAKDVPVDVDPSFSFPEVIE